MMMAARAAGFNFVRLHTHTELPEYFEAAALLDGLVDYAASDRFAPKSRVEMATLPPR